MHFIQIDIKMVYFESFFSKIHITLLDLFFSISLVLQNPSVCLVLLTIFYYYPLIRVVFTRSRSVSVNLLDCNCFYTSILSLLSIIIIIYIIYYNYNI